MKFYLVVMALAITVTGCKESVFHDNGEDLLTYEKNGRFGYINRSGAVILEAKYLDADLFYEGLAAVEDPITRNHGFIDTKGIYIVPPKYSEVGRFVDGAAPVKKSSFSGQTIPWGLINKRGELLKDSIGYGFPSYEHYSDGIFSIAISDNSYGLNTKGEVILEDKFSMIGYFVNGVAQANAQKDKEWSLGYINKKGEYLVEPKYSKGYDFKNSEITYVSGKENGVVCHYLINKKGEEIKQFFPLEVLYKAHKDENGNIDSYEDLTVNYPAPYYPTSVPEERYTALPTGGFYEGFALAKSCVVSDAAYRKKQKRVNGFSRGTWHNEICYIDTTGEILKIPKGVFPSGNFSEGLAAVFKVNEKGKKKYGYINKKGEIIIEPKYDRASKFSEGLAGVKDSETRRYNFIDTLGNEVITQNFYDLHHRYDCFKNGVVKVQKVFGGDYNFINKKGEFIYKGK